MSTPHGAEAAFRELRPLMFAIAYRMLGSVAEAEDVVQEAFLRYHRALAEGTEPESPKAYLSAVTTRLAIDQLRSARVRRQSYVGEWLPEPVLSDPVPAGSGLGGSGPGAAVLAGTGAGGLRADLASPADLAEQADSLSLAFLLVLERLSPVERAVFLLHDVFGYGYDETAAIVGRSQDNCRQLARRARQHVAEERPRYEASRDQRQRLADRFFAAVGHGDMDGLVSLLSADVEVHGDAGRMRPRWTRPIIGRDKVARLLLGLAEQARPAGAQIRPAEVNGQPGALFLDGEDRVISVLALDIVDGRVQTVRSIFNHDKLGHLGPLADVGGLMERLRQEREREPRD